MSFFVVFSIGPHNLEFLAKNPLSFWPEAKNLNFCLEFFAKCTKNKPVAELLLFKDQTFSPLAWTASHTLHSIHSAYVHVGAPAHV